MNQPHVLSDAILWTGRVTTISFEKHLPRLFLEQLERYRETEPFTLRVRAAVMMSDISGFSALAIELTRDGALRHFEVESVKGADLAFAGLIDLDQALGGDRVHAHLGVLARVLGLGGIDDVARAPLERALLRTDQPT